MRAVSGIAFDYYFAWERGGKGMVIVDKTPVVKNKIIEIQLTREELDWLVLFLKAALPPHYLFPGHIAATELYTQLVHVK